SKKHTTVYSHGLTLLAEQGRHGSIGPPLSPDIFSPHPLDLPSPPLASLVPLDLPSPPSLSISPPWLLSISLLLPLSISLLLSPLSDLLPLPAVRAAKEPAGSGSPDADAGPDPDAGRPSTDHRIWPPSSTPPEEGRLGGVERRLVIGTFSAAERRRRHLVATA
ncbi:hypothetical protein BRADI_3g45206v3, partial [Brachypodium distachyon]